LESIRGVSNIALLVEAIINRNTIVKFAEPIITGLINMFVGKKEEI
jgi:hypothetical protein